jgi:hypothetical protein
MTEPDDQTDPTKYNVIDVDGPLATDKSAKPKPKRKKDTVESIQIKLDELRSNTLMASIITRKNYLTLLQNCPPDLFDKICKRLFLAAVTDNTGQAAFAALQYIIGKPASISMDPNQIINEMRALARIAAAKTMPVDSDSSPAAK